MLRVNIFIYMIQLGRGSYSCSPYPKVTILLVPSGAKADSWNNVLVDIFFSWRRNPSRRRREEHQLLE